MEMNETFSENQIESILENEQQETPTPQKIKRKKRSKEEDTGEPNLAVM